MERAHSRTKAAISASIDCVATRHPFPGERRFDPARAARR
jgi:hypothetical protein